MGMGGGGGMNAITAQLAGMSPAQMLGRGSHSSTFRLVVSSYEGCG